jgi:outer membrane protein assembly factor BamB
MDKRFHLLPTRHAAAWLGLATWWAATAALADRWDWSQREPVVVWQSEIGAGFASVAVHGGRVFAFGNVADEDHVTALDAGNGRPLWTYRYPCRAMGIAKPDEPGPRATPFVHEGAVYTLSRDGRLLCLEATTGNLRWWRDVPAEVGERPPYWGFSGSPMLWNDLLIWSVGDHGLAIRASSGEVAWKSAPRASTVWKTEPVGTSGYTTPQPVTHDGRRLISLANESQWVLVDPVDGRPVWSTAWEVPYGVTSAEPFVAGDRVMLSGGYGYGTRVVRVGADGPPLWANKNLRSHFANLAVVGEHLYGIDGNQQDGGRCELRCLRLADGEIAWTRERFGFANLTFTDGRLLILSARGELVAVRPDPAGYRETGRFQVLGGESWTAPLVAGQHVFVRNKQGTLARVDLP